MKKNITFIREKTPKDPLLKKRHDKTRKSTSARTKFLLAHLQTLTNTTSKAMTVETLCTLSTAIFFEDNQAESLTDFKWSMPMLTNT